MVKQKFKPLGVEVELNVPSTNEEFGPTLLAQGIKAVTAWVTLADWRYYFIHGISEDDIKSDDKNKIFVAGTKPIEGVETITGIERKTEVVVGKDGKPKTRTVNGATENITQFTESEEKFYKRVLGEKSQKPEDYSELGQAVADVLVFNAEEKERAARTGPVKLAKKYKEKAAAVLANGNVEAFAEKYATLIGKPMDFTATNDLEKTFEASWTPPGTTDTKKATVSDKDAEALGWKMKEYVDAFAAKQMDTLV